jgi:hypothetical protein
MLRTFPLGLLLLRSWQARGSRRIVAESARTTKSETSLRAQGGNKAADEQHQRPPSCCPNGSALLRDPYQQIAIRVCITLTPSAFGISPRSARRKAGKAGRACRSAEPTRDSGYFLQQSSVGGALETSPVRNSQPRGGGSAAKQNVPDSVESRDAR